MSRKIKKLGKILEGTGLVPGVWEFGIGVPELVEEGLDHRIDGTQPLRRRVLEESGDQVDSISICLAEHLTERMRLDLGELVLHVVRIHGPNLLSSRSSQDLDDLY